MDIKILEKSKDIVELEISSNDPTIAEMIVSKLNEADTVEFASYKWEHPLEGIQKIYIKTKSGDPLVLLKNTIKSVIKELDELQGQIK